MNSSKNELEVIAEEIEAPLLGGEAEEAEFQRIVDRYAALIQSILPENVTFRARIKTGASDRQAARALEQYGIDQAVQEDAWERAL